MSDCSVRPLQGRGDNRNKTIKWVDEMDIKQKKACITETYVVYFYQLLGAACTRKLVKLLFSSVFDLFLYFSPFFITKSTEKRQLRGIPSGSQPAFACQPALRSRQYMQKNVFCSFSNVFSRFQTWNHWKRWKINKQGWKWMKTAVKSGSTSFWVRAAPESWSKHTTDFSLNTGNWNAIWLKIQGLTKKVTCLRGLKPSWPRGRNSFRWRCVYHGCLWRKPLTEINFLTKINFFVFYFEK